MSMRIKKDRKNLIKRESLTDRIVKLIHEDIFERNLLPGSKISLTELAAKWGISITPLREAIRKVEAEGLITSVPGKGFIVRTVHPDDVKEIFIVRKTLESLACKLACKNITEQEIKEIEKIQESLKKIARENKVNDNEEFKLIQHLNKKFHFSIYNASGNKTLVEMISLVWGRTATIIACILSSPKRLNKLIEEHDTILDALKKRDEAGIQKALKKHLSISGKAAIEYSKNYKKNSK